MTEGSDREPELQSRIFVVGDRPHEVWDWDLDKRNLDRTYAVRVCYV